jgi:hypothetical protein
MDSVDPLVELIGSEEAFLPRREWMAELAVVEM